MSEIKLDPESQAAFEGFLKAVEQYEGIDPEINLLELRAGISPYSFGMEKPEDDQVHVIFFDEVHPKHPPLGVLRLTRALWDQMKRDVDCHLAGLTMMKEQSK